jgi:DNA-binding NtrC family response regulator
MIKAKSITEKAKNASINNIVTDLRKKQNRLIKEFGTVDASLDFNLKASTIAFINEPIILLLGDPGVGKSHLAKSIHRLINNTESDFIDFFKSPKNSYKIYKFIISDKKKPSEKKLWSKTFFFKNINYADETIVLQILEIINNSRSKKLKIILTLSAPLHQSTLKTELNSLFLAKLKSAYRFHIPILDDRRDDIPNYAKKFVKELTQHSKHPIAFRKRDLIKLRNHIYYAGNLDDLKGMIERMLKDSSNKRIDHIFLDYTYFNKSIRELSVLEATLKNVMINWDYKRNGNFLDNFIKPVIAKVADAVYDLDSKNSAKILGLGKDKISKRDGLTAFQRYYNKYNNLQKFFYGNNLKD